MRILLAAEGESDEIVAEHLLRHLLGAHEITKKRFPSRGFQVVRRAINTLARAAHFGLFDCLVVHFDLDSTLPPQFEDIRESSRWQEIDTATRAAVAGLRPVAARAHDLMTVLMTPRESTEAWLAWGRDNRDGTEWEGKDRHLLKREIFGDPPRGLRAKTLELMPDLLRRMQSSNQWPRSLRTFASDLVALA